MLFNDINIINYLKYCFLANGVLNSNENHSNNYLARIDINSKKRHRRIKSNHKSDQANGDGKFLKKN